MQYDRYRNVMILPLQYQNYLSLYFQYHTVSKLQNLQMKIFKINSTRYTSILRVYKAQGHVKYDLVRKYTVTYLPPTPETMALCRAVINFGSLIFFNSESI